MSLMGMTGFGRAEGAGEALTWRWEVRSVNGRGLDLRLRLPSGWDALETGARERIRKRLTRGSVQANLQIRSEAGAQTPRIDETALEALLSAAEPYVRDGRAAPPRFDGLLSAPGVLLSGGEEDEETRARREALILEGLDEALVRLEEARRAEGVALEPVLSDHIAEIERLTEAARESAGAQPAAIRERIKASLDELLESEIAEERLAAEAAMLALKADIREELDRLGAHVAAARELIAGGSPCGRKLDFLIQELLREANTLCSKSADMAMTRIGLDLKAAVDQLKEQSANVE